MRTTPLGRNVLIGTLALLTLGIIAVTIIDVGGMRAPSGMWYRIVAMAVFPCWLVGIGALVLVTSASRRQARFRRENRCWKCGYSRAGLDARAVCPECGAGAN